MNKRSSGSTAAWQARRAVASSLKLKLGRRGRMPRNLALEPVSVRFWRHVKIGAPNECWPWNAGTFPDGYGRFAITHSRGIVAHRFAWIETRGKIPNGLRALHTCDNPPCCNPGHLFIGTNKDNTQDCIAKGRFNAPKIKPTYRGKNWRTKISIEQVGEVMSLHASGESNAAIGRKFSVTRQAIRYIINTNKKCTSQKSQEQT